MNLMHQFLLDRKAIKIKKLIETKILSKNEVPLMYSFKKNK